MAIDTAMPRCKIEVQKAITQPDRKGSTALGTVKGDILDLTPYLGDSGAVMAHRSMRSPVGGFEITFPDKPFKDGTSIVDSLYGLLEPMDRVTLRMARNQSAYPGVDPPIIMRGFVRSVARQEAMDGGGRPHRTIVVRGDDYGCLLELVTINFWGGAALGAGTGGSNAGDTTMLSMLLTRLELDGAPVTLKKYVEQLVEKMINQDMLDKMQLHQMDGARTDPRIERIKPEITVTQGNVEVHHAMAGDGTILNKIKQFVDSPWNEFFLEDRWSPDGDPNEGPVRIKDDGPVLVIRPTPYKDKNGSWVVLEGEQSPAQADPPIVEIQDTFARVIQVNYQRSDMDVGNIYIALSQSIPGTYNQKRVEAWQTQANSLVDDPRVHKYLYGARPLEVNSYLLPNEVSRALHIQAQEIQRNEPSMLAWYNSHWHWLRDAYVDNPLFEHGSMTVQGNEQLKIGTYYTLTRGQFTSTHYITDVIHQFLPFQKYTTTVQFIRSDNYIKRLKSEKPAVLMEGHKGVYSA